MLPRHQWSPLHPHLVVIDWQKPSRKNRKRREFWEEWTVRPGENSAKFRLTVGTSNYNAKTSSNLKIISSNFLDFSIECSVHRKFHWNFTENSCNTPAPLPKWQLTSVAKKIPRKRRESPTVHRCVISGDVTRSLPEIRCGSSVPCHSSDYCTTLSGVRIFREISWEKLQRKWWNRASYKRVHIRELILDYFIFIHKIHFSFIFLSAN